MLKDHKKRHHHLIRSQPGGSEVHCCTPVFVNHPLWGAEPPQSPRCDLVDPGVQVAQGAALPIRRVCGVRVREGHQR